MHRLPLIRFAAALLVITAAWTSTAQAQDETSHQLLPESRLWIEGTSNKSDWTVEATEMEVAVNLVPEASAPEVQAARVTVPSAKIVSDKSTIMDRLMHKALMADEHPDIVFELTGAETAPVPEGSDASFALNTTGRLTLAGETKEVELPLEGTLLDDDRIRFTGQHTLLMSDYGMQPPSAMFGALRTGDEVTVHFDLLMEPRP